MYSIHLALIVEDSTGPTDEATIRDMIWYDIDTTTYVYIYKVPEPNWTAETRTDTERTGTKEVLVPS